MIGTPIMAALFEQGITPNLPVPMPEQGEWMRRLGTLPLRYQPGERTQVGATVPSAVQLANDFWTTLYQAIDD